LLDEEGIHVIKLYPAIPPPKTSGELAHHTELLVSAFEREALSSLAQLDWIWYVIRCQERASEVEAYEEGKMLRGSGSREASPQ